MQKVCLITGASRGIGRVTAEYLARRGYTVYTGVRDVQGRNQEAALQVGEYARVLELDVTHAKAIQSAVALVEAEQGRLDVLINNAGHALWGPVEEVPLEAVEHLFEVNFFGCLRVSQAVLPLMRRQGSGVIVQISSISGRVVTPLFGMYQASKHALEAMSEAMAYEVGHFGIRVVLVEPGNVNTSPYIGGTPALLEGRSAYQELQQRIVESRKHRGLSVSEPLEVAEAIVAAIEDPATPLRVVVGASAKTMDAVRRQSTDEQYARWLWEETKVAWSTRLDR